MCLMLFDLRYGTMNSLERYFRWHGRLVARQVEKQRVLFFILDVLQLPGGVPAGLPDVDPDPGPGPDQLQRGARPHQGENTGL